MRYVLAALGALLGMALGRGSEAFWNLLIGAGLGFAFAEMRILRSLIGDLSREIKQLTQTRDADRRVLTPAPKPDSPTDFSPVTPLREVAKHAAPAATPPPPAIDRVPGPAAAFPRPRDMVRPASPQRPERLASENPLLGTIHRFFMGGNTLVRVGIIVLFFGVAFLLRYAAEHSHVPIELRLSGVAIGAIALLAFGWRLRHRRSGYAFALEGGGVGILYLTVFAAFRLYNVLPPSLAFAVLVLIALLAAAIAVLQNSQSFALLGLSGGFLAPILASTGNGSHVTLFSYFLVLNSGIATVAWFKSWRALNLAGFVFTFAIATSWGVLKYRAQDFLSTEPFLAAFFLLFVAIAVLYAVRQPLQLRGYVDSTLVFGTPIAAFGLQTAMLHQNSLALAYSSLVLSGFYLLLSFVIQRFRDPKHQPLFESFLALSVVFLTLAIPLALGNRLNSAAWALEGTGVVWIGCRQQRKLARAFGTVLIMAAAVLLAPEVHGEDLHWELPWGSYAAVVLVSVACMMATRIFESKREELDDLETLYRPVLFAIGTVVWCMGSLGELPHLASGAWLLSWAVIFLAATAFVLSELARRVALPFAAGTSLLLLPLMCLLGALCLVSDSHPSGGGGWLAWPLAFACLYVVAYRHEAAAPPTPRALIHVAALWLVTLLLAADSHWMVMTALAREGDWATCAAWAVPALVLLALRGLCRLRFWPFAAHAEAYATAGGGLALILAVASVWLNLSREGDPSPLPYVPLINPLDVIEMLMLVALLSYERSRAGQTPQHLPPAWVRPALAALLFIWCNGVVLRTLHHRLGIPYTLEGLFASNIVQTCMTIFWSVLALFTMLLASRRQHRATWLTGAGLLVVVIAKLFLVDLSSVGSIERIISFVGVGLLMLIIGYFSPLPPRAREMT